GPDSICPPGYGGGDEDAGEEVSGELVVSRGDASEVFEPAEHPFDEVAALIGAGIVGVGMLAGGLWRDHRFGAAFGEPGAQAARVVGTIGEQPRRAWHDREQRPGAIEIVGVASGKLEGEGPPLIVAQ